jgi:hypothetical protein
MCVNLAAEAMDKLFDTAREHGPVGLIHGSRICV